MYKAYKYRLYPNKEQKVLLEKHFGSCRFVYNYTLYVFKEAYTINKEPWNKYKAIKIIAEMKKHDEYNWLKEVNSQSLQQSVIDLDSAFKNFFKHNSGFPKFKSKHNSKASFRIPQNIDVSAACGTVKLPKFKEGIKIKIHRPLLDNVKFATISRTSSGKYYISIVCNTGVIEYSLKTPNIDNSLGIDVGIKNFAVTSNGSKYDLTNTDKLDKRIRMLSRRLSKKLKGSKNRLKAKYALSRKHEKLKNVRRDFLHKLSRSLVNENQIDFYFMENLNIKGMVKNRKLAKSVQESCWYTFKVLLNYKAEWTNKQVIDIDRWYPSSKTCSFCGYKKEQLSLSEREWVCPLCGTKHDRDINAAINIRNVGITTAGTAESHACGENIRPAATEAVFVETGSSVLKC